MTKNICKKCNQEFSTQQSLDRHINKKFKCDQETKFKCNSCNKSFKYNKNLKEHQNNSSCKSSNESLNILNTTLNKILISTASDSDKIFAIKNLGINMIDNDILQCINLTFDNDVKISILIQNIKKNNSINNSNNTTNNTTNNITNNIQINFGEENISYLNKKYYENLIKNNLPEKVFLDFSNEVYLNEQHPENQTIKVENINNKLCKIKESNKWVITTKDDATKKIFDKFYNVIAEFIDENENLLPLNKIQYINKYLDKELDDPEIIEVIKKIILKIYNFHNTNEI